MQEKLEEIERERKKATAKKRSLCWRAEKNTQKTRNPKATVFGMTLTPVVSILNSFERIFFEDYLKNIGGTKILNYIFVFFYDFF
jgi:hypothetical protein